jgi:ribose transport system substrate-binding protein
MYKAILLITSLALSACGGDGDGPAPEQKPQIAFVTNGVGTFWTIASKGVEAAAKKFDADAEVLMPGEGVADQKRIVQALLARGIDGIAISPIDPDNQIDLLNEAAANTHLITHDSDAPKSNRLCFIGIDNYSAGRECGKLVKEALPEGGNIMIFVGRLEQLNARQRRQGVIDELLDRSFDPERRDPNSGLIRGDKYTVLDTRTDLFDYAKAKAQVEDAIAKYPDLHGVVGLFAYNPPMCLEAIKEAGKTGQIKIIAFDEEIPTLQGIIDGHIYGTVVQNPYKYGYESVRILAGLKRGDRSVLPPGGVLDVPARQIRRDNVEAFWAELKQLTGAN